MSRSQRACLVCSVVQDRSVFMSAGCPNCEQFLHLRGNADSISECTSPVFEGLIALSNPQTSWVAKWQRLAEYMPGLYATKVVGALPDDIIAQVEEAGVKYIPRDGTDPEEADRERQGDYE